MSSATPTSRRSRARAVACVAALASALLHLPPVAASPSEVESLKALTIEQLMELDVTSVSRRPEPAGGVAAAISIITAEDLRRSGVTNLADAMRLAGGLHVARFDSHTWGISARGFTTNVTDKMLVLIDGRSVYTPLFSGVFWDAQDTLLEDVERIEVIRGPGGTLWGANAMNGVISITTRSAARTQGGLLTVGGGDEERGFGAVRWGGAAGENGHWRAYGKAFDRDGLALADGGDARDDFRRGQAGFRGDWELERGDTLTVQGDLYRGEIETPDLPTADIDGGNLLARWTRVEEDGARLSLQAYYDHTWRRLPLQFQEDRDTFDLELQRSMPLGGDRHYLVFGGGYRVSADQTADSRVVGWVPSDRTIELGYLYAQDEIRLVPDTLRAVIGTRLEHHDTSGWEVQPTLRMVWNPSPDDTVWASVSRAVRAPARIDQDARFTTPDGLLLIEGSPDFAAEELLAYELGYRAREVTWGYSFDVFRHEYDELRSFEPPAIGTLPLTLGNGLTGETWGATLQGRGEVNPRWRVVASYTFFEKDLRAQSWSRDTSGGVDEGNDPRHLGFVRSSHDVGDALELDLWLRFVDELPAPRVPGYTELDVRLAWRPRSDLELAIVGRNLLRESHPEFGPDTPERREVERRVHGQVTWRF